METGSTPKVYQWMFPPGHQPLANLLEKWPDKVSVFPPIEH